MLKDNNKM